MPSDRSKIVWQTQIVTDVKIVGRQCIIGCETIDVRRGRGVGDNVSIVLVLHEDNDEIVEAIVSAAGIHACL